MFMVSQHIHQTKREWHKGTECVNVRELLKVPMSHADSSVAMGQRQDELQMCIGRGCTQDSRKITAFFFPISVV